MKKQDLKVISKSQKIEFLKNITGKGSNFKPFINHIQETFRIQESGLYKSDETLKIMSLEQIREIKDEYFWTLELVDKSEPVDRTDPSFGLIPCEIQLAPYTIETFLIYSQRDNLNV